MNYKYKNQAQDIVNAIEGLSNFKKAQVIETFLKAAYEAGREDGLEKGKEVGYRLAKYDNDSDI